MDFQSWLEKMGSYLQKEWGIEKGAALRFAMLYAYFWSYGLNPTVTSGFRSKDKQAAMRAAWDRGERAGLKVRPAAVSQHSSAKAMDIKTSDPKLAAEIATALGMKAGYYFSQRDEVHFEA